MTITIDARGEACPRPVMKAKEALIRHDEVAILVDDSVAVENLRRLALRSACGFAVKEERGYWEVVLTSTGPLHELPRPIDVCEETVRVDGWKTTDTFVVVLTSDRMGNGDDALGEILMRSFITTVAQMDPPPAKVICYNGGVKMTVEDAPTLEDLRQLEAAGTEILICGTCVNYFGIADRIRVGHLTNMYDIAAYLATAGKVLRP